jgi:hypothetical protein
LKLDIGLTMNEIARLARQCPKDKNGLLLYGTFLAELSKPGAAEEEDERYFVDLEDFVAQLKKFMG